MLIVITGCRLSKAVLSAGPWKLAGIPCCLKRTNLSEQFIQLLIDGIHACPVCTDIGTISYIDIDIIIREEVEALWEKQIVVI